MHTNTTPATPLHTGLAIYSTDDGIDTRTLPMRHGATAPPTIDRVCGRMTLRAVVWAAEGESVDDAILREVRETDGAA